ncbi:hypothetical protein D7X99_12475 [Corallococcus sp. AB032C]|nr:hypothetical protein D7X99_12475 [Corallococcus sp. AB032C]
MWNNDSFSPAELDDYLHDDGLVYGRLWRSFERQDRAIEFSDARITAAGFAFNQNKYIAELGIKLE